MSLDSHGNLDLFPADFDDFADRLERGRLRDELDEAEAARRAVLVVVEDEGFVDLSEAAEDLAELGFVAVRRQALDVHLALERLLLLLGHLLVQRELLHVDLRHAGVPRARG